LIPKKLDLHAEKTGCCHLKLERKNWLEKFLPSVVQFSQNADIYVIDNLSTDDSIAFLNLHFPSVKIIRNNKNYGFAGGYNEGLKKLIMNITVFLILM
jgi:GT2 family glycosyltransferase